MFCCGSGVYPSLCYIIAVNFTRNVTHGCAEGPRPLFPWETLPASLLPQALQWPVVPWLGPSSLLPHFVVSALSSLSHGLPQKSGVLCFIKTSRFGPSLTTWAGSYFRKSKTRAGSPEALDMSSSLSVISFPTCLPTPPDPIRKGIQATKCSLSLM